MKLIISCIVIFALTLQDNFDKKFENEQITVKYAISKKGKRTVLTGRIFDRKTNPAVPFEGMNIVLKDHPLGTVSNKNGYFTFEVPVNSGILQCSFIGFKSFEIKFQ
ncbi:MAG: carboxypeptidase-like regulatory domain-containing protein [bacterium]|jgi:hypothetical protein|nr:carboxypeptidase-like regulatory domain-containing protein [bacterium]